MLSSPPQSETIVSRGSNVVAVMRAGQVHPSPTPDFTLTAGDLMVAVGTSEGLDDAVAILAKG